MGIGNDLKKTNCVSNGTQSSKKKSPFCFRKIHKQDFHSSSLLQELSIDSYLHALALVTIFQQKPVNLAGFVSSGIPIIYEVDIF